MSPYGGDERVRTDGLLLARQALSQLSYTPLGFRCCQVSLPYQLLKVLFAELPQSEFASLNSIRNGRIPRLSTRYAPLLIGAPPRSLPHRGRSALHLQNYIVQLLEVLRFI